MLNKSDAVTKVLITKNLLTDQTYQHLHKVLNSTNVAFSVTEGLGRAAAESSLVLTSAGGFPDQKVIVSMKYVSPTSAGAEDFGAVLRCQTTHTSTPSKVDYYWARLSAGTARITKVLAGSFVTLTQTNFALAQDTLVTITFSVVGSLLSATFEATGGSPATVSLSATDTDITDAGLIGFRSYLSTFYCRSFTAEQL